MLTAFTRPAKHFLRTDLIRLFATVANVKFVVNYRLGKKRPRDCPDKGSTFPSDYTQRKGNGTKKPHLHSTFEKQHPNKIELFEQLRVSVTFPNSIKNFLIC